MQAPEIKFTWQRSAGHAPNVIKLRKPLGFRRLDGSL